MVSKGLDSFVLWPHYFDSALTRRQGRRVSRELAVKAPDGAWVESAAKRAGVSAELESEAKHPSVPYEKKGRVLVEKKGSKEQVLDLVAQRMREMADKQQA